MTDEELTLEQLRLTLHRQQARIESLEMRNAELESCLSELGTRADRPQVWSTTELKLLDDGYNRTCCDPRFVRRAANGKPISWTITLNEYQRSNLLWLLCDVAGYDRKQSIVNGLMTGDWAGEIPNALRCNERGEFEESEHRPNMSVADARKLITLERDKP